MHQGISHPSSSFTIPIASFKGVLSQFSGHCFFITVLLSGTTQIRTTLISKPWRATKGKVSWLPEPDRVLRMYQWLYINKEKIVKTKLLYFVFQSFPVQCNWVHFLVTSDLSAIRGIISHPSCVVIPSQDFLCRKKRRTFSSVQVKSKNVGALDMHISNVSVARLMQGLGYKATRAISYVL